MADQSIAQRIAAELGVRATQVEAAVELLDSGATVPFVARYRKEATGGLDDSQLRTLEERLNYLRELDQRKEAVLKAIDEQGRLTEELAEAIRHAETKTRVEDLYRPYQRKRRTKAQIAREAGLGPLAEGLLGDPSLVPEEAAAPYVTGEAAEGDERPGVPDIRAALEGARQILMERFAEDADLLESLRDYGWRKGYLVSRVISGQEQSGTRFQDYFDHTEPLRKMPSHRALAMLRGQSEEILRLEIAWSDAEAHGEGEEPSVGEAAIARHFGLADRGRPADAWLGRTARLAWRGKLATHLDLALKRQLREQAEEEAIRVFGANLKDLLLAAPAGPRPTIGLDPGLRTGVKAAAIDATGAVVDTATLYPFGSSKDPERARERLASLIRKHGAALIAIGNGTASRETDRFVGELLQHHPELGVQKVVISEAGASVYSASEHASRELPDLDVSLRGNTSTTSTKAAWDASSTRSWKTASTPWVSMPIPPRHRCWHGSPGLAPASPTSSSPIATSTAASAPGKSCRTSHGLAPRPLSKRLASCASPTGITRWTPRRSTPRPIPSSSASASERSAASSR